MKHLWETDRAFFVGAGLMALAAGAAWFLSRPLFYTLIGCLAVYIAVAAVFYFRAKSRIKAVLRDVGRQLGTPRSEALSSLKIPVVAADGEGKIVWLNREFAAEVSDGYRYLGRNIADVVPRHISEELGYAGAADLAFSGKIFAARYTVAEEGKLAFYYLFDQTEQRRLEAEYSNTRPVVGYVTLDAFDELVKNAPESETSRFRGMVQREIERWIGETSGLLRRVSNDRYIFVVEERHYSRFAADNFPVLKRIRELKTDAVSGATVSVGIGRGGGTLAENAALANQALDMAGGRGGDQVAVMSPGNNFKFYGGVNGAVEKRGKVRVRVMASALRKLVAGAENVLVMGHKYADLDCLGSAFGVLSLCRSLGKDAHILLDRGTALAKPLIPSILKVYPDAVIDGAAALPLASRRTLLVLVDVHRPSSLEYPEVLRSVENVVVIDHHRKAADCVSGALIFFHETAVSSASEMVTELLQYADPAAVTRPVAEGLLSGIMLDTKNFTLHTGVGTFEAAAFLRSAGADPVAVRKMFLDSAETYRLKSQIVASAEIRGDYAVAVTAEEGPDTRIATSQAADELLGVDGVAASFVIFPSGGKVCVSARSFGEWNVQVIMESLGGGGHRTMSGCQLDGVDLATAADMLDMAIKAYRESAR